LAEAQHDCIVLFVKTLTIAAVRRRLGYWGKRALGGEDVRFVVEGRVIALRPVEVSSADYARREYGVTERQLDRAVRHMRQELRQAKGAGQMVPFAPQLRGSF
jgi:hypothetical protein